MTEAPALVALFASSFETPDAVPVEPVAPPDPALVVPPLFPDDPLLLPSVFPVEPPLLPPVLAGVAVALLDEAGWPAAVVAVALGVLVAAAELPTVGSTVAVACAPALG